MLPSVNHAAYKASRVALGSAFCSRTLVCRMSSTVDVCAAGSLPTLGTKSAVQSYCSSLSFRDFTQQDKTIALHILKNDLELEGA